MQGYPAAEVAESQGLVDSAGSEEEEVPRPQYVFHRRRRVIVGAALLLGAAAGLALKTALTPCLATAAVDPDAASALVSLAALDHSEGLATMAETERDGGAVGQWLAAGNAASAAASEASGAGGAAARAAVERAMATEDPAQAQVVMKRAMRRAISKWQTKRRALKQFLKARNQKHLKGSSATNSQQQQQSNNKREHKQEHEKKWSSGGAREEAGGAQEEEDTDDPTDNQEEHKKKWEEHQKKWSSGERTPAAKAAVAACVFDSLQATTQLAALAVNINDAVKTCTKGSSCGINVANIFYSIGAIAAELSFAATNCADTATTAPNVDALCAGTISAIIQTLAQVAVSAEVIAAGCVPRDVPAGLTPSNIGSAGAPKMFNRRLGSPNATDSAEGRRLLAGGGKGATATYCAIDVSSAAWYLAQAGLRINEAGNENAGATCPPKGKKHFMSNEERAAYAISQSFCTVSIGGALYGLLQAIYFINFAFVHCADELNARALCGAGVDGLITATAGVAYAGAATFLTCEELQKPVVEKEEANETGSVGVGGRRLSEDGASGVEELKRQFSSPADVWKSIGFDLEAPNAELRNVQPRRLPSEELLGLVEEPAHEDLGDAAGHGASIFGLGGPQLCS